MIRQLLIFIILILVFPYKAVAQVNTIGVINANDEVAEGYTLFAPNTARTTYLIDNCGNVVNSWLSETNPGLSAYLLPNGNLIRTRKEQNGVFFAGGTGGGIEIFDWDGNILWEFVLANDQNILHHDIAPMPNGNILAITYDLIPQAEALSKGRALSLTPESGLWVDKIIEIKPLPNNDFEIVWEWSSFDHIIQEVDANIPNFGVAAQSPGKFHINYITNASPGAAANSDWLHSNAIDYNPVLDQIILNSRNFSEFYIIDHTTTTAEASTGEGGQYGKGGDLLYRWGNPAAYDTGVLADQQLFGQHDAHWIDEGLPDAGKVFVFNNGINRPGGTISTVDIIDTPVQSDGSYDVTIGQPFGPEEAIWSYGNNLNDFNITSPRISGVSQLPNGNVFVCVGSAGRLLELNENLDVAWEYILPLAGNEVLTQGDDAIINSVFRAYKYPLDYPAFTQNQVSIGDPIELNPNNEFCILLPTTSVQSANSPLKIVNTLAQNQLIVSATKAMEIAIVDVMGKSYKSYVLFEGEQTLEIEGLSAGSYFIQYISNKNLIFEPLRFVKIN